jgi:hypothetical protein
MPDAVTDLENAIDDIAESNVWVGGGGGRC